MILPLISLINAATVVVDWNITYVQNVNPDGLFAKRVIGVNGKWPIPTVQASLGDLLVINVENQLDVPTAIHTHGLYHNNSNYMDGAGLITECGIAPNTKLTYSIPIQQTGTYWIHGHMNGQYVDGLQTALILTNGDEIYKEYVLSFTDWYHEQHQVLVKEFLGIFNPQGSEPIPNSALLNHGVKTELLFEPGKTYRLRLISMTALAVFNFYIDDHKLKIIEVDGELVEPFEVDVIPLASSQRYSVLVTAKDSIDLNYKVHAKMDQGMLDRPCENPNATASIIYNKNAPYYQNGVTELPSDPTDFNALLLTPIIPEPPTKPDVSIVFDAKFQLFEDATNHGSFNGTIFEYSPVPPLFTALTMKNDAMNPKVYGPRANPTVLKHMDMVELIINNFDGGPHPFHLHGHKFQVVQVGKGRYGPSHADESNKNNNPVRRDTVIVPGNGFAVLRFRADNPGVWFMHCHVEWHLQAGLASVFIEAPDVMQQKMQVPQQFLDQCKNMNRKTSGNAAGFDDLVTFTGINPPPKLYPDYIQAKGYFALAATVICALLGLWAVIWYASFDFPQK